jgi:hypothetical protein
MGVSLMHAWQEKVFAIETPEAIDSETLTMSAGGGC